MINPFSPVGPIRRLIALSEIRSRARSHVDRTGTNYRADYRGTPYCIVHLFLYPSRNPDSCQELYPLVQSRYTTGALTSSSGSNLNTQVIRWRRQGPWADRISAAKPTIMYSRRLDQRRKGSIQHLGSTPYTRNTPFRLFPFRIMIYSFGYIVLLK